MVHDAVSQHEGSVLSTESFRVEIEERALRFARGRGA